MDSRGRDQTGWLLARPIRVWLAVLFLSWGGGGARAASGSAPGSDDFQQRFRNPPAEARILKIIHSWPDQPEAQDSLMTRLTTQGFGGVVCNVSFDRYLESDAKWGAFVRAVTQARKNGMALWLYDERGYPSGNAGGLTLKGHPDWEARGLLISEQETRGGPLAMDLPPGQVVLATAFPVGAAGIDLSHATDLRRQARDRKLTWEAPPGQWRVLGVTEDRLYEGTHAEGNLAEKMPYPNLLMPEPTARFIELTHQGYARHLGNDLGRYFMGTFTDEPSLMSVFLRRMPYRVLPWGPNLPAEFKKRRGYNLETALLPALMTEAGPGAAKARYDYWQTIGELVAENFFGQIQTWCRRHRVPSGGHLLMEESLVNHVPFYGDFFRCLRRLDAPSIDCLTSVPSEVPWQIARLAASAAELEGRSIVMCETSDHGQVYRPKGDRRPKRIVTEAEIRGACNRLMVSGVNCITSYYSFTDLSDEQLRRLNEWVGRCCAALAGGRQVTDLALLYPAESLWTKFVPSRHWSQEAAVAARVENAYRAAAESLFAEGRDFTIVDSRAVREARVEAGALAHGPLRWRALVLPGTDTLPLAAWENLARFVRSGGVLVALGSLPANSESEFPSSRVAALAREVFGPAQREPLVHTNAAGGAGVYLPGGSEALLPLVLGSVIDPDVRIAPARSPLRVTHRRIAGSEVFFLVNDSAQPWSGELGMPTPEAGERWDPATGQMSTLTAGGKVGLSLAPYGAALLRYKSTSAPARRRVTGGPLPGLALRPTPAVRPTVSHGQYVQGELKAHEAVSNADAPLWKATGRLTKSQVDTFLFARFHYEGALDLSAADCLAVETWTPEGQKTPSQLLIILHEAGGGDFLVETGRSLAAPGRERSYLPWSRFHLAGWSKDADGVLDLKRVSDISVGWGGYLGAEGEQVSFSVAPPQAGAVGSGSGSSSL